MKSREGIRQISPEENQEDFESAERERRSIFQWLRERGFMIYMAATLSAGTPLKHERLEAAEIPPGATWSEGIKILQNGVLSDEVETKATFYIDQTGKREKWIFGKEGERARVTSKTTDIAEAAERELSTQPAQSITLCELHTHPISAGEEANFITEADAGNIRQGKHSVSFPPSDSDLSLWTIAKMQLALKGIRQKGVAVEIRDGVIDPAGITYHRPITDEDLRREFPHYFTEVEQTRAAYYEWDKAISHLLQNLDAETLDRLHRLTKDAGRHAEDIYAKKIPAETITEFKRDDLKIALFQRTEGAEEIAQTLIAGNTNLQKLYDDFIRLVRASTDHDERILDQARLDWIKTSMTISPDRLPATKEYAKLREAFARNMAYIRFVSHQDVPNEPPCAGTDYKP